MIYAMVDNYTLARLRAFCVKKAERYRLYATVGGGIQFSLNENKGIFIVIFNVKGIEKAANYISKEVKKEFGFESNLDGNKLIIDLKRED